MLVSRVRDPALQTSAFLNQPTVVRGHSKRPFGCGHSAKVQARGHVQEYALIDQMQVLRIRAILMPIWFGELLLLWHKITTLTLLAVVACRAAFMRI